MGKLLTGLGWPKRWSYNHVCVSMHKQSIVMNNFPTEIAILLPNLHSFNLPLIFLSQFHDMWKNIIVCSLLIKLTCLMRQYNRQCVCVKHLSIISSGKCFLVKLFVCRFIINSELNYNRNDHNHHPHHQQQQKVVNMKTNNELYPCSGC